MEGDYLLADISVLHKVSDIPGVRVSVPPSIPEKQLGLLTRECGSWAVAVSGVFPPASLERSS